MVHFLIILQYYHHLFYLQLFFIFLCLYILLYIVSLTLFYFTFYYFIKDVKRLEIIVLSTMLLSVKQINYILSILIIYKLSIFLNFVRLYITLLQELTGPRYRKQISDRTEKWVK